MVIVLSVTVVSIPSPAAKVIVSPSVTGSAVPFSASIVNAVPDEVTAPVIFKVPSTVAESRVVTPCTSRLPVIVAESAAILSILAVPSKYK